MNGKSLEEVRAIARSVGLKVHHKSTIESLTRQINAQSASTKSAAGLQEPMHHIAETNVEPTTIHSQEAILTLLKPFLEREYANGNQFTATFPVNKDNGHPDNTVIIKVVNENGRTQVEESIHMSTKLRVIKIKAEHVAAGRRVLRGHDTFDKGVGRGYADTVLA